MSRQPVASWQANAGLKLAGAVERKAVHLRWHQVNGSPVSTSDLKMHSLVSNTTALTRQQVQVHPGRGRMQSKGGGADTDEWGNKRQTFMFIQHTDADDKGCDRHKPVYFKSILALVTGTPDQQIGPWAKQLYLLMPRHCTWPGMHCT